jgi:hypothetical protein
MKRIAAKSSAMTKQTRLVLVAIGLAFALGVATAAPGDSAEATPKKTRTDPCVDLKPDKNKAGEKKAPAPAAKPADAGKR